MTPYEKTLRAQQSQQQLFFEIGMLATDWSMFEYHVNDCIFMLADVDPVRGACMTSQIFTLEGRFNALISLMHLREISPSLISKMNVLWAEQLRPKWQKRNRAIHDPVVIELETHAASRVEITAKGTPKFHLRPTSAQEVLQFRLELAEPFKIFAKYRQQILDILSTSGEKQKIKHPPIHLTWFLPE